MDKKYIEENDIAMKYLRDRLTPEETDEFETHFLADEALLEQLELDSILLKYTGRAFDHRKNKPQVRPYWINLAQIAGGMIAGAILLVITTTYLNIEDKMQDNIGVAQIEYFDELRSVQAEVMNHKAIDLSPSAASIVLVIDTGEMSNALYDIVISEEQNIVVSTNKVSAADTGELKIVFPTNLVPDNTYTLKVFNEDTTVAKIQYVLSIKRSD